MLGGTELAATTVHSTRVLSSCCCGLPSLPHNRSHDVHMAGLASIDLKLSRATWLFEVITCNMYAWCCKLGNVLLYI